ncbi:MAG: mechanosensitive ion channel [Alphaproteobacteria bacterium]|nr:mechanosensitive ion channel [Alphaproteobacteria bacterium]
MFDISNISETSENIFEHLRNAVTEPANWIQVALIVFSMGIGWAVRKRFAPRLIHWVDRSGLNFRIRQTLKSLTKLILQVVAVFLIGIFLKIQTVGNFAGSTSVESVSINLLMAWIVIRSAAQIIGNSFARQTVVITAWAIAALSIVGLLDETVSLLEGIGFSIGDSQVTALAVIKAVILIFTLLYAALFLATLLDRRMSKASSLTPSSRVLITKILRVFLIGMGLLIGITSAGVDLSLLAVFGGALGLGIGFGLQKGVSNLFSGILLLLDKSINPGDIIELQNGVFGWINEMGARYTSVVTRDNKSYLIPNEDFITQQVINWSHSDTLVRMEVEFGVHYASDPHVVRKIASEVAVLPDRVVNDPAPVCHLSEFGDSSLNFKLRFWITDAEEGVTNVKGQVLLGLWDAFKENNIKIPYPHREIYIRNEKTEF